MRKKGVRDASETGAGGGGGANAVGGSRLGAGPAVRAVRSGRDTGASRRRRWRRGAGMTLLELLMVVTIAGVLMGVAAPAATELRDRAVLRSAMHLLHADLNFARGEAIRRRAYVSLCPSRDGRSCSDDDWQAGWIVFEDAPRSGEPHGERILRVQPALSDRLAIIGNAPVRRHVGFSALGVTRARNGALLMGTFRLCHTRRDAGHALIVNRSGRIRRAAIECQQRSVACRPRSPEPSGVVLDETC